MKIPWNTVLRIGGFVWDLVTYFAAERRAGRRDKREARRAALLLESKEPGERIGQRRRKRPPTENGDAT